MRKNDDAIVLYDGYCNLCSGFIRFIKKRNNKLTLIPLQSIQGEYYLTKYELKKIPLYTVFYIEQNQVFEKSTAIIKISRKLNGYWKYFYFTRFIPEKIRDTIYDVISRYRYKWFGKRSTCALPE